MAEEKASERGWHQRRGSGSDRPVGRVLVPIDFSDGSRASLDRAAGLAAGMNAAVDLLHVWPRESSPGLSHEEPSARLALARAALAMEDLRREALGKKVRASRIRIAYGSPAEAILRVAGEGYELIVMGGHRVGGSVAGRVAAGARCPVMTVDGAETGAGAGP